MLNDVAATTQRQTLRSVSYPASAVKLAVINMNVATALIYTTPENSHEMRHDHATFIIDGFATHIIGVKTYLKVAGNVYY